MAHFTRALNAAVVVLVAASGGTGSSAGAAADLPSLALRADFQHSPPTGPGYLTLVRGVLDLRFTQDPTGTALATFVVGHEGCFMIASWQAQVSPPQTSQGAELCIAAAGIAEADVSGWLARRGPVDPSLAIPLTPSGPDTWVNPAEVAGELFVRGCGSLVHRKLGDLRIPVGLLTFQRAPNQLGQPEVTLSVASVMLENTVAPVWSDVRAACGGAQAGLPDVPVPGVSQVFAGTTQRPPPDPSLPHVPIDQARDAVDGLVAGGVLTPGQGKSLARRLDKSVRKLQRANLEAADRQLERFQKRTTALEIQGVLTPPAADVLRDQAAAARSLISLLGPAPEPGLDPDLSCNDPVPCPDTPCVYTTYHVRAGGRGIVIAPDGSAERPFRTISDALARATVLGLCGVDLMVAGGVYAGDIVLDRNTRIHGSTERRTTIDGSISSAGPYRLVVENVFLNPTGRGVDVSHPCASTSITDVNISRAQGYGIVQRSGVLVVRDATVDFTQSQPDFITRGTGIFLTCGVAAVLDGIRLDFNEASALQVVGEDTLAFIFDLDALFTRVHPDVAADPDSGLIGALGVRSGARLIGDVFYLSSNDLAGLVVSGLGSRATLRHGTIRRTRALASGLYGTNVMVIHAGELELTTFESSRADLCGIQLALDGEADLHRGTVSRNLIGVNLQTAGFDLARLQDDVLYLDNEVDLDAAILPVPAPASEVEPLPGNFQRLFQTRHSVERRWGIGGGPALQQQLTPQAIQLGLDAPLFVARDERERLIGSAHPVTRFAEPPAGVRVRDQEIDPRDAWTDSLADGKASTQLLQPLGTSRARGDPAAKHARYGRPVGETMRCREGQHCVDVLGRRRVFAAQQAHPGHQGVGQDGTDRMLDRRRPLEPLGRPAQRLVRMAAVPEVHAQISETTHGRVVAAVRVRGRPRLHVRQRNGAFQVRT